MILQTPRLILRRQRHEDVDALVAIWTDPEVTRHMGGPRDEAPLREALESTAEAPFADEYDLWPVVDRSSGRVVGHCGLLDKEVDGVAEIEVTYVIAREHWGRGYATEIAGALRDHAFERLGLRRVIALIEPENEPSRRVAEKIGMRRDRTVERPGGSFRDVYVVNVGNPGDQGGLRSTHAAEGMRP